MMDFNARNGVDCLMIKPAEPDCSRLKGIGYNAAKPLPG